MMGEVINSPAVHCHRLRSIYSVAQVASPSWFTQPGFCGGSEGGNNGNFPGPGRQGEKLWN